MARKRKDKFNTAENTAAILPKAMTETQARYIDYLNNYPMVLTLGPAGTGKTFIAATMAAYFFKTGKVTKIVLTRPTVPTGKSIGFFPGSLEEKMEPWVFPFIDILEQSLTKGAVETMIKNGKIEIVPFEVIRGRTFQDAFVILDEAQNSTKEEVKAFVTRVGENTTTVINGDISQSDLKHSLESNGLSFLLRTFNRYEPLQEKVKVVEFTSDDIVRSGLCKLWVKAFE